VYVNGSQYIPAAQSRVSRHCTHFPDTASHTNPAAQLESARHSTQPVSSAAQKLSDDAWHSASRSHPMQTPRRSSQPWSLAKQSSASLQLLKQRFVVASQIDPAAQSRDTWHSTQRRDS
jgi:hypothetical protein